MEKLKLPPYHSLMTAMMVEERSRPIDEQFPLLRSGMDDLTSNVRLLSDASQRLCRTEENEGKEMEVAVSHLFSSWLQDSQWEFEHVPIRNGKIFPLEDQKADLVQWDGIINAEKLDEKILYLIETKQIAHVNNILKPGSGLYDRGVKTRQYLLNLKKGFTKGMNYNLESKTQNSILGRYPDCSITVVYASGSMNSDVKGELIKAESQYRDGGITISVLKMECPRLSTFSIASPSVH